jgi:AraC-like DNA-binding protein
LKLLLDDGYAFSIVVNNVLRITLDAQFFFYALLSLRSLYAYRRSVKDNYSTIQRIDLSWLRFVLYGFIVWRSLGIIETALYFLVKNDCVILVYIASLIVFLVFVSIMVFRGLSQPQIFLGHGDPKQDRVVLPKEKVSTYVKRLKACMESEKPYINSELTLDTLSEMTSIPSRHLSKVLNEELKQNFFDFVNRYRVEEAKKLLRAPNYRNYTILAVAFEAGFNSKSTFNLIFKKYTHRTPSQYRKAAKSHE